MSCAAPLRNATAATIGPKLGAIDCDIPTATCDAAAACAGTTRAGTRA